MIVSVSFGATIVVLIFVFNSTMSRMSSVRYYWKLQYLIFLIKTVFSVGHSTSTVCDISIMIHFTLKCLVQYSLVIVPVVR